VAAQVKQAPQYAVTFLVYDLTKKALAVDNSAPPRTPSAQPAAPAVDAPSRGTAGAARRLDHWQQLMAP